MLIVWSMKKKIEENYPLLFPRTEGDVMKLFVLSNTPKPKDIQVPITEDKLYIIKPLIWSRFCLNSD